MEKKHDIPVLLERLARVLHNDAYRDGLKPTQWEALRYLARANRFSRSPGAVTAYLGMTKGTVSQTLNALERKALIKKTSDPTDRRNIHIEITAMGRKALRHDPVASLSFAIGQLSRADKAFLSDKLEFVLLTMLRERGGRPFGACKTCRYFKRRAPKGKPHYCSLLQEPRSDADDEAICVEQEVAA